MSAGTDQPEIPHEHSPTTHPRARRHRQDRPPRGATPHRARPALAHGLAHRESPVQLGRPGHLGARARLAVQHGVRRLVLLSGRGEEGAQRAEQAVQASGAETTVVRATWFNQNFSEGGFLDMVRAGDLTLPVGDVLEPFVDADDIADVAVAALTQDGHAGQVYELTGPRLLSFAQAADEIARAAGRPVRCTPIPLDAFTDAAAAQGEPPEVVALLRYLFSEVLDGRNARLADGVQRALGRAPKDFAVFAREVAAGGVWALR
jgi:uncharacterized protein YbjT (DUF2867 family)